MEENILIAEEGEEIEKMIVMCRAAEREKSISQLPMRAALFCCNKPPPGVLLCVIVECSVHHVCSLSVLRVNIVQMCGRSH